jgi:hypothetical protein
MAPGNTLCFSQGPMAFYDSLLIYAAFLLAFWNSEGGERVLFPPQNYGVLLSQYGLQILVRCGDGFQIEVFH